MKSQSRIWSDILKVGINQVVFLNNLEIKVGNGKSISFWKDNWMGGISLSNEFPRLYALLVHKNAFIADMRSDRGSWNILYRRQLRAWEE